MSTRRTSVLTLVVAAVAVSTAAVGTIAVPADAAVAGSSVSIRVPHSRIEAGDSTRVLGHLHVRGGQDSSGRTVTLEARPKGATGFSPVGTAVTGPHGGLSLDVAPSTTTRYQWFYPGAADV